MNRCESGIAIFAWIAILNYSQFRKSKQQFSKYQNVAFSCKG